MEENDVVRALAALAQPMRLRVFRALVGAGPAGQTPGTLTQALAVPATTLSFHLKELTHAGLVSQQRDGRSLIYRASFDRMNALLAYLTAHCCQGVACLDVAPAACIPAEEGRAGEGFPRCGGDAQAPHRADAGAAACHVGPAGNPAPGARHRRAMTGPRR